MLTSLMMHRTTSWRECSCITSILAPWVITSIRSLMPRVVIPIWTGILLLMRLSRKSCLPRNCMGSLNTSSRITPTVMESSWAVAAVESNCWLLPKWSSTIWTWRMKGPLFWSMMIWILNFTAPSSRLRRTAQYLSQSILSGSGDRFIPARSSLSLNPKNSSASFTCIQN